MTWNPTQNFQNAGLIVYGDDANYVKTGMVWNGARNFELIKETNDTATFPGGAPVPSSLGQTFFLRLVSSDGNAVQAQFSADGQSWTNIGASGTNLTGITNPRIGVYATASNQAGAGQPTASYHSVTIEPDEEVCPPSCLHSDEFDGTSLDTAKWTTVRNAPGFEHSIGGGQLTLPILDEIDGTRTGPISHVAQQLQEGTNWTAEAKVTVNHQSSWQQAGIMLWQSDTNFVKVTFSRNANNGNRYFEITADNPPNNTRNIGMAHTVPADFPATGYVRMIRAGNSITGAYSADGESWTPLTGTNATKPVDAVPPREGPGVVIGPYAGSDIDGDFESTASFDYFRTEPDDCPDEDETSPETTVQLNGAAPVATYDGPVSATFTAIDPGEDASGVDFTEYRIDGGAFQVYDTLMPPMIAGAGPHAIEYRSTDLAGNVEATKSVSFEIEGTSDDTIPPMTTAQLNGADPEPTYDGPVEVSLSATDPAGGQEPPTHEVAPDGFTWNPDALEIGAGDTVEWDFGGAFHDICLDTAAPVGPVTGGDCGADETLGDAADEDTGGSRTFTEPGSFLYYCSYHWPSMQGDLEVTEAQGTPGSGVATTSYSVERRRPGRVRERRRRRPVPDRVHGHRGGLPRGRVLLHRRGRQRRADPGGQLRDRGRGAGVPLGRVRRDRARPEVGGRSPRRRAPVGLRWRAQSRLCPDGRPSR